MDPVVSIVGIVATASVIRHLITSAGNGNFEPCVDAFYADKFNGDRHGSPSKTFLKCMKANNPELFKEVKARYRPAPSGEQS